MLATTATGAFESSDLGRTWRRIGEPASRLRGLSLGGGHIYARTDFDGVVTHGDHILNQSSGRSSSSGGGAGD